MINEKLNYAKVYKDPTGIWWIRLEYSYEEKDGKHAVIFPKVTLPFTQQSIPEICFSTDEYGAAENPYIQCYKGSWLYKGTCGLAQSRGVTDVSECFNIITEPAKPKKMTISEIEDELGYSIQIVDNKEDKNGSCEEV